MTDFQQTTWTPQPPMPLARQRTRPSWQLWALLWALTTTVAIAALAIALTAKSETPTHTGAASAAAAPAAPTTGEVAVAKDKACQAASRADKDLRINTNRPVPTSPDDSLGWANTAIARTSLVLVATWLPTQIDPATPKDIAAPVRAFASAASEYVMLSETEQMGDASLEKAFATLEVASKEAARICHERTGQ
jgi:hypothetical protein